MNLNELLIFLAPVFFACIRVVMGPTHQLRDLFSHFFTGLFVGISLSLANFLIYGLLLKGVTKIDGRVNYHRFRGECDYLLSDGGIFPFSSILSLFLSWRFFFHDGWTAILIHYVLFFPCICGPLILIAYLFHQRGIRKEQKRKKADRSPDQTETEVSPHENG